MTAKLASSETQRKEPSIRQDVVLVAARFPRALYEELERYARVNMRPVGKECVFLCEAALREREMGKRKQRRQSQGEIVLPASTIIN